MQQFLILSPPPSVEHEPAQPFHQNTTTMNYQTIIPSPVDTSIYKADTAWNCCEACKCNCKGCGCNTIDTGQQHAIHQDHIHTVSEALHQLMITPSSENSYGAGHFIDEESCAPNHQFVAPSLSHLGQSPAHRTPEEMRADRWATLLNTIDADPFPHFVSLPEDGTQSFDDTEMFDLQEVTESTMATPGLSGSSISLLSGWSHLFPQGGNNSNSDLTGIGGGV